MQMPVRSLSLTLLACLASSADNLAIAGDGPRGMAPLDATVYARAPAQLTGLA